MPCTPCQKAANKRHQRSIEMNVNKINVLLALQFETKDLAQKQEYETRIQEIFAANNRIAAKIIPDLE